MQPSDRSRLVLARDRALAALLSRDSAASPIVVDRGIP